MRRRVVHAMIGLTALITKIYGSEPGRKLQFSARLAMIAETPQNWASPTGVRRRVFGQGE
jgi:hypothetical protein